jgi:hypothetical protein
MTITTAIFIKNGEHWRLRNHLLSIYDQDVLPDEVLLMDFGSSAKNRAIYKQMEYYFPIMRVVEMDGREFHPAKIANEAVRQSKSDFIIMSDIDVVYSTNAYKLAKQEFSKGNFIMCARLDLPPESNNPELTDFWEFWKDNQELRKGHGSFQGMSRKFLIENPYDEGFKGWGFYDMEMEYRARDLGYNWTWLNKIGMKMMHVYHDPLPYHKETKEINKKYFFNKRKP